MRIEYRPGSLCYHGRPKFVRPPKDVIEVVRLWLQQAPKLNEEERKVAATTVKYLMVPPIIVSMEQETL